MRNDLKSMSHVEHKISSARRRAFGLMNAGLSYPGLDIDVKTYLWKSAVRPILTSGMNCLNLSVKDIRLQEKCQSHNIKRILGFSKRCLHSKLLLAL